MLEIKIWWFLPVFFISAIFVAVVLPAIVRTANKMDLYDTQDERKVHKGNVPRLGGVSFVPAILFSLMMVIAAMSIYSPFNITFSYGSITEVMLVISGCLILYLVGVVDDIIGVTYKYKFIAQIMAAILLCISGLWINNLHGIFGIHALSPWLGVPLTLVLIVLIINSVNLIDGIDGLASGLCIMGTAAYSIVFLYKGLNIYLLLAAAMLGVLIIFYIYNTLGKPGVLKTFMGDTGSLTMGYLLSFFAIKLTTIESTMLGSLDDGTYFVYAFSVLLIPVMDVFRVFFARIREGFGPFYPDKRHIHHKFLAMGFTMRQARYLIFAISLCFFTVNMVIFNVFQWGINILIMIDAVIWILMNMAISNKVKQLRAISDPVAMRYTEIGTNYRIRKKKKRRN